MVSGQFWRGQEVLSVPAQSVGVLAVTYRPMAMTPPGHKHAVSQPAARRGGVTRKQQTGTSCIGVSGYMSVSEAQETNNLPVIALSLHCTCHYLSLQCR